VKPDPRLKVSQAGIDQQYAASKLLEGYMDTAAKAVKQLVISKGILSSYQKRIKEKDSIKYKNLLKKCKEVSKEMDALIALFLGKEDKRQGIVRNPESTVMTRISGARRYVASRPQGITSTEETLMMHAENETKNALAKVNAFYKETWETVQAEIEGLSLSSFKPIDYFELKE